MKLKAYTFFKRALVCHHCLCLNNTLVINDHLILTRPWIGEPVLSQYQNEKCPLYNNHVSLQMCVCFDCSLLKPILPSWVRSFKNAALLAW